jgi:2-dehydropantoate 2-reductase
MKIAVVGAGAMGSIFGARFHDAGHETVLVDVSKPLVDKINADGVTIVPKEGGERTVRLPATTDPASVGPADLVVFFVKCYHTASAAESARPLVGPETVVASLQNGWGNGDVLASVYPPQQVVIGVTYNSGTVLELGKVAHPGVGPTLMGRYEGDGTNGAARLAEAISDADLEAEVVAPVRPEIWKKLILNAASLPASALTGMTAGALGTSQDMLDLVSETTREAVAVAQALGYDIDFEERIGTILGLVEKAGPTKASMLQDVEAGRRTEIDVINGAVVRAADEVGVPVPINRTLMQLIKGWETQRGLV